MPNMQPLLLREKRRLVALIFGAFFPVCVAAVPSPAKTLLSFTVTLDNRAITISIPSDSMIYDEAMVSLGNHHFTVPAVSGKNAAGPAKETLEVIRAATTVEGGYLFIGYDCECTAHRSPVITIFAIRHGNLVELGDVGANDDMSPLEVKGFKLPPGEFIDMDEQLEDAFSSHASGENLLFVVKERNDKLIRDPRFCWQLNGYNVDDDFKTLGKDPKANLDGAYDFHLSRAYTDKFCNRPHELHADLVRARSALSASSYQQLVDTIKKVRPNA